MSEGIQYTRMQCKTDYNGCWIGRIGCMKAVYEITQNQAIMLLTFLSDYLTIQPTWDLAPRERNQDMIAKWKMGTMGQNIEINFEERDWYICISRTDGKADNHFGIPNEQEVGPTQIAYFVPNWQNLERCRTGIEGISEEAYIQDGDYKLNLICPKESHVDLDIAIQEFTEFMAES